jgi:hypothetical protein
MGSTTTKLSLYKPAVDEEDWGVSVNTNFDTLDDALVTKLKTVNIISVDFVVTESSEVILVDLADEADIDITLPAASSCAGQTLFIKIFQDGDGALCFIIPNGADSIDSNATSFSAFVNNNYIVLISNGVDGWYSFGTVGFTAV